MEAAQRVILNGYDWTFCLMQYNYMDTENQAGTKGLKLAAEKGLAVVIMEPLSGGRLANPPQDIQAVIDNYPTRRSAADWALQWIWNQPETSVVLSGMSDMSQVEANLQSAGKSGVGSFDEADLKVIEQLQQIYRARTAVPCTKCGYCMPCPNGVNIPRNFQVFNDACLFDDVPGAKNTYSWFLSESEHASNCIQCKVCEERCPQVIEISECLSKVNELLSPDE